MVGLVGLWDGLCRDFIFTSTKVGEQRCASLLSRSLRPGDLLLADRNFTSCEIFARVLKRGADFLMHLQSKRYTKNWTPTASGRPDEWLVTLTLPRGLVRKYPYLPAAFTVRILKYQLPGFRASWLITSLTDAIAYPYDEIVSLYHERWRQETAHREWKHTLRLSNLRSKTKLGLLKEVFVQLILNNAVRWIMTDAAAKGKRPVDYSFLNAKRLIMAQMIVMAVCPAYLLPVLYQQLLEEIAKNEILVRPGRRYPRKSDVPKNKGNGIYTQPALVESSR